ncbi:MAG: hypothetical protein ABF283_05200 [Planktotalea arctica]
MVKALKDIQVKCGYLGPRNRLYIRIQEMLAVSGIKLQDEMSFDAFTRQTSNEAASFDFLFVDIDGLGGVVKIFNTLARLRTEFPFVPVILISGEFETNDFDTTRRLLGDVSLRSPVLHAPLETALFESIENNRKWCDSVVHYRENIAA